MTNESIDAGGCAPPINVVPLHPRAEDQAIADRERQERITAALLSECEQAHRAFIAQGDPLPGFPGHPDWQGAVHRDLFGGAPASPLHCRLCGPENTIDMAGRVFSQPSRAHAHLSGFVPGMLFGGVVVLVIRLAFGGGW